MGGGGLFCKGFFALPFFSFFEYISSVFNSRISLLTLCSKSPLIQHPVHFGVSEQVDNLNQFKRTKSATYTVSRSPGASSVVYLGLKSRTSRSLKINPRKIISLMIRLPDYQLLAVQILGNQKQ